MGGHIGRPYKLQVEPERMERFVFAIRSGASIRGACAYAGISDRAYYNYMHTGERDLDPLAREFYERVKQAEGDLEVQLTSQWLAFAETDWRAIQEFMSRRFKGDWSPTVNARIGDDSAEPTPGEILGKLLPELAAALEAEGPGDAGPGGDGAPEVGVEVLGEAEPGRAGGSLDGLDGPGGQGLREDQGGGRVDP